MKLPVRHEAFVELDEAITFYEEQRPGLGLELLDAVAATVSFAAAFPEAGESRGGSLERDRANGGPARGRRAPGDP